jgi:hypothetical protein
MSQNDRWASIGTNVSIVRPRCLVTRFATMIVPVYTNDAIPL